MSDKNNLLDKIKEKALSGEHVKCEISRYYMHPKYIADKDKKRNRDNYLWSDERVYTLLYRNDVFIIKTNQWHNVDKSSSWKYISEKWFNNDKNSELRVSDNYVSYASYLEYPGIK
jgi:hypothetical protein